MSKLPEWKRLHEETVYKGRMHIVEHDVELPDGSRSKYEVDHAENAVAVLIKTPENKLVLSHQYRFPLDKWIYDLPGGGAQAGETLKEAASRECREEVGIEPTNLQELATFYPNPGRSDWSLNLFFCDAYTEAKPIEDDPSEKVERVLMAVKELEILVQTGEIIDPSLLIGWHAARSKQLI
jgi:ADP-ribose pyrophosphatase